VLRWLLRLILLSCIISCAAAWWWVRVELATPYYGGGGTETFVDIPRRSGTGVIGNLLANAGIIRHALPFVLYLRWTGAATRLQAGEYRFSTPATPPQIADRLIRGDTYYISVTVPEGLTAQETVELIASAGLSKLPELLEALSNSDMVKDLDPKAANLEGYLFPETYHFGRRVTAEAVVKTMVNQFHLQFGRLLTATPMPPEWNCAGIVTLASMIEKEVKTESERPLVASVLINRLRVGMPLACDPTIIYALKVSGSYDGNLHKADLALQSPYNSYLHAGLPPGPISNPGLASLRAALSPAHSDYFYYVSRNDGTHQFSKDFRTHLNWVLHYQKRGMHSRN